MPRNAEVIRQWQLLLHIERSRFGLTVDEMAAETGVGKRTIWRDMAALQEAGFPLTSEKGADQRTRWMLMGLPLKALHNPGLSLVEVCSLYMSRALLAAMPGAAFADGLAGLMKKIEKSLSPALRGFLDQLPGVVKVKPGAVKRHQKDYGEIVARLIDASSNRRVARMRLLLRLQQPREGLHRPPAPCRLLRWRPLPHRVGARVRPGAELRGGAHRVHTDDDPLRWGHRLDGRRGPGLRSLAAAVRLFETRPAAEWTGPRSAPR